MSDPAIHLISYGDGDYRYTRSAIRLCEEALKLNWFSSIICWNLELLRAADPAWVSTHEEFIGNNIRGHGYWIWKSKIISLSLQNIPEGDILVYLDAGDEINAAGKDRFFEYINLVNNCSFLIFYLNGKNLSIREWTKHSLLKYFGINRENQILLDTPQMESLSLIHI